MPATRGDPLQGSRSAHDVTDPNLHASDIENDAFTVHLDPDAAEGEAMVMGAGGEYLATDIATQEELDALTLDDLADVDTTGAAASAFLRYNIATEHWEVANEPISVKEIVLTPASSPPSNAEGALYYDAEDKAVYVCTEEA